MSRIYQPWLDETMAANGRPIKENFAEWFGASKVLDAQGSPLVVYHGTKRDFDKFERRKARGWANNNVLGHFFTRSSANASEYSCCENGSNVMPVFLALENPYIQHVYEWQAMQGNSISVDEIRNFRRQLIEQGHDGIIDSAGMEYIAFSSKQIKSAISNSGLFQRTSASLTDLDAALKLQRSMAATSFLGELERPGARP